MAYSSQLPAPVPPPVAAFHRAADVVANQAGIPVSDIIKPSGRAARRARQLAFYLAVVGAGCGMREVARVVGVDHTVVRWSFGRIEDMRDDTEFDRHLTRLEEAMQS